MLALILSSESRALQYLLQYFAHASSEYPGETVRMLRLERAFAADATFKWTSPYKCIFA